MNYLILEDQVTGEEHLLPKYDVQTIGRANECNITTLNPEAPDEKYSEQTRMTARRVSGLHARIEYEDNGVFVIDLGSKNGTYLLRPDMNQPVRVSQRTPVPLESRILLSAKYALRLKAPKYAASTGKGIAAKTKQVARSEETSIDLFIRELA
jgi:pSer/pThr/pTyr-binding forkhead associated (FHA) protein